MINQNIQNFKGNQIDGVEIKPLGKIPDERGSIYHMLRADDDIYENFGEIYFSKVYPGVVKGWHIHREMTLNYTVIYGMIKLVLYDERHDSKTNGNLMEIFMGEDNYVLVKVPPMVWNGFKGIGVDKAIVVNCASIPHDPEEISRKEPYSEDIPYNWGIKQE